MYRDSLWSLRLKQRRPKCSPICTDTLTAKSALKCTIPLKTFPLSFPASVEL
uniref:Uncharacterized protein n=1 Tax=Anguilla anguilla TaxID=7936 RepID=A0A0E9SSV4_ANGAN